MSTTNNVRLNNLAPSALQVVFTLVQRPLSLQYAPAFGQQGIVELQAPPIFAHRSAQV